MLNSFCLSRLLFALTIELNSGQRHYEFTKSEISGKENGKHFGTSNKNTQDKNVRINSEYLIKIIVTSFIHILGNWWYNRDNWQQKTDLWRGWKHRPWKLERTIWFPSFSPGICRRTRKCLAFPLPLLQKWRWCFLDTICINDGTNWSASLLYGGVSWTIL